MVLFFFSFAAKMQELDTQICQESFNPKGKFKDTSKLVAVEENEKVSILQEDVGSGFTLVRCKNGDGFVPTSIFPNYSTV